MNGRVSAPSIPRHHQLHRASLSTQDFPKCQLLHHHSSQASSLHRARRYSPPHRHYPSRGVESHSPLHSPHLSTPHCHDAHSSLQSPPWRSPPPAHPHTSLLHVLRSTPLSSSSLSTADTCISLVMKHTLNTLCLDYEEESSPPSHDAITLLLDFEQLISQVKGSKPRTKARKGGGGLCVCAWSIAGGN